MQEKREWKKWKKSDWHLINRIQWDERERESVERVFSQDWFGYGELNQEFERKVSYYTGIPHINLTNSGSAAIVVALLALMQLGYWNPGDLILHPVTTFATSISSALNLGMVPVFIDSKENTYVADPEGVERAINKYGQIKGMVLPHLLGNIADLESICSTLDGRFLIEDCCDTLGGKFNGKHVGSFGNYAAFSFYGSHHLTAGGVGGALGTNDRKLHDIARSFIFWGRDFKPADDEFLKRYTYETLGTDSQMTAFQAAFGSAQIDKLEEFVRKRDVQFREMSNLFLEYDFFHLPVSHKKAEPSWFAYPLTIKGSSPFTRQDFAKYLTGNKVEIRPLMCGNILRQEPFRSKKYIAMQDKYSAGDSVENNSLFIPCWGMPEEQKEDYYDILRGFLKSHKNGNI